jgi:hypothetical protein
MLDFADQYLRTRRRGDRLATAINLGVVAIFVFTPLATLLERALGALGGDEPLRAYLLVPAYCSVLFLAHAAINFPLEFWYGYALDRQFGLARDGARFWVRAWTIGVVQQGVMFVVGSCFIVIAQTLMPHGWIVAVGVGFLLLFLLTRFLEADLLPVGLFQFDRIMPVHQEMPTFAYGHIDQRDMNCTVIGLGVRRVMLISRPALAAGAVAREELCHAASRGGRNARVLLAMLSDWLAFMLALMICDWVAPAAAHGSPVYLAWLALILSGWMLVMNLVESRLARAGLVHRLWMWLPVAVCRNGIHRFARPAAWFITPGHRESRSL